MSQFSRLRQALTPKSGSVVLAFFLAFLLEMLARLGRIALFLILVVLGVGLYALGVFVAHKLGFHPSIIVGGFVPLWSRA